MNLTTQVNLPKMKAGGLDVSFMIVYVGQSNPPQVADAFQPSGYDRAYKAAVAKFDAIHRLTKEIAPNDIELALTAADVVRIAKSGRKVAVIGIENGYPLGTDIKRVQGVLGPRRPVHVARAQRPQPALRLEHRRGEQPMVVGRPLAARPSGHRGNEQVGHHGRRLAPVEGRR